MNKSDVDIIVHKNKESRSHVITPLLFMRRYILADKWLIRRGVNIVTESQDIIVVFALRETEESKECLKQPVWCIWIKFVKRPF